MIQIQKCPTISRGKGGIWQGISICFDRINKIIDALNELTLRSSNTVSVNRTAIGTSLDSKPGKGGGPTDDGDGVWQ